MSVFINPNAAIKPGDDVIIQSAGGGDGGDIDTFIKRLVAEDKENWWVEQYNPQSRIAFRKKYVKVHRVVPGEELF